MFNFAGFSSFGALNKETAREAKTNAYRRLITHRDNVSKRWDENTWGSYIEEQRRLRNEYNAYVDTFINMSMQETLHWIHNNREIN